MLSSLLWWDRSGQKRFHLERGVGARRLLPPRLGLRGPVRTKQSLTHNAVCLSLPLPSYHAWISFSLILHSSPPDSLPVTVTRSRQVLRALPRLLPSLRRRPGTLLYLARPHPFNTYSLLPSLSSPATANSVFSTSNEQSIHTGLLVHSHQIGLGQGSPASNGYTSSCHILQPVLVDLQLAPNLT